MSVGTVIRVLRAIPQRVSDAEIERGIREAEEVGAVGWNLGLSGGSIVAPFDPEDMTERLATRGIDDDHVAYYGGRLVAESIAPDDARLIVRMARAYSSALSDLRDLRAYLRRPLLPEIAGMGSVGCVVRNAGGSP